MVGFTLNGGGDSAALPALTQPASALDILKDKEAIGQDGKKIVGEIASKSAQTYTPDSSKQVISAGQYLSGDQTISAVPPPMPGKMPPGRAIWRPETASWKP